MDTLPDEPSRPADTLPDEASKPTATLLDTSSSSTATLPDKPIPDKPIPDKPRRRRGFKVFVAVVFVLAALLTVGFVMHRSVIRSLIIRDALKRGFVLEFADFAVQPDRAQLFQVKVTMVGVPGLEARFGTVQVDLQGLEPLKIQGSETVLEVTGASDELQKGLLAFTKQHSETMHLPVTLDGVFQYGPHERPAVAVAGKWQSLGDGDVSFEGTWTMSQTKLGTLSMHQTKERKVDLGFGLMLSEKPVVNISFDATVVPFQATVKFAPQKVDDVCKKFDLSVPKGMGGAMVEGSLSFVLDGQLPSTPHHGSGAFVVNGWVPPHPRELDGIVYGTTTKLGTTFEVLPDLSEVRFPKATVDAGALHLEGKGNALRDGFSVRTKMDLSGNIACTELGASAIGSHVRGLVGEILRGVTRMTMGGTVKVRVLLDADTNALSDAKLDQSFDIGCRLR